MKKVVIIGGKAQEEFFTHEPRHEAEVWCINGILKKQWDSPPRVARHFNIHYFENLKKYGYNLSGDITNATLLRDVPFYTSDEWPVLDNQVIFPRAELERMPRGDYHCGSFDWLVAFAVLLGAKEIDLHGIGLCLEAGEPISSRACLEYWCGYAAGKGIKVTCAPDCDIFHFYHLVKSNLVYGYDDTPIFEDRTARKMRPTDKGLVEIKD